MVGGFVVHCMGNGAGCKIKKSRIVEQKSI